MKHSILLVVVVALSGCGPSRPAESDQPQAIPIRTRTPHRTERPSFVSASGTVEANLAVDAAFELSGRVGRVYVEEGQAVRPGQVLASLDATDYTRASEAAAAQVDAARATAQKAEAGPRKEELEQARIDFEHWQEEYKRMKFLFERKSLPAADFEKVESAFQAAQQRYKMAREGTRAEDKQAANAAVRAASAQAAVARKRVDDTRLLAPIGGFIGLRRVDPGEMVGAGVPVFSIVDLNPVKVRIGIPEAEIGQIRERAPATVIIPALNARSFAGRVELVGVAADPASRTYTVKVSVPNPDRILRAGMVAEARVQGSGIVNALTLPGEAIVRDAQGATLVYIYYPGQKRVHGRLVEVGPPLGSEIEIRSGLSGDEQVVIAGQQTVREGSAVELTEGAR